MKILPRSRYTGEIDGVTLAGTILTAIAVVPAVGSSVLVTIMLLKAIANQF